MRVQRLRYDAANGWSGAFPELDTPNVLILVFGASRYLDAPAPIGELRRRYPAAVLTGCSSSGEVFDDNVFDDSLSVAIVAFDATTVRMAVENLRADATSTALGRTLAARLDTPDLRSVMLLSDGLGINGTELARGITEHLPEDVIVTGGLAGDGDRFARTWVIDQDGVPRSGLVVAIGFYGDAICVGHGSRGGWNAFGPEREITRAEQNVLFELDGKPALDLYKEYLGARAAGLPATGLLFPLAIRRDGDEEQLVRTILSVDERAKSMTFAGDIPQGCRAQLMMANFDRLIDGAAQAAQLARRDDEHALTTFAIAISCVGRRLVLGERADEELEATLHALPSDAQMVGFYSYGEISPNDAGTVELHNQTMTLTTIQERCAP